MTVDDFRLVIINDDPDDAAQLRQCLLRGFEREVTLVEARTGDDGLVACLGRGSPKPDCVIVDLHLPDMSGLEVLERLKDDAGPPCSRSCSSSTRGTRLQGRGGRAASRGPGLHRQDLADGRRTGLGPRSRTRSCGMTCLVRLHMKRAALDRRDRELAEFETVVRATPAAIWIAHDPAVVDYREPGILQIPGMAEDSNASPLALETDQGPRPFQEYRDGQPVPPDELPLQTAIAQDDEIQGTELTLRFNDGRTSHLRQRLAAPRARRDGLRGHRRLHRHHREEAGREGVKDADKRKDEFLAMLAHELRNPLAAIRSSVHLIRLKAPDDPA